MRVVVPGALAIAVATLLAGCFFGGPSTTGGGGTGGGGQSGGTTADETTSPPGDVDLEDFVGLPSGFPASEIPLVEGDIPIGVDLGTGWSVVVKVADFSAAFAEASDKLKSAGFEAQAENITADGSIGVYINDKYQVNLTAGENPDYGPSLNYVVVKLG